MRGKESSKDNIQQPQRARHEASFTCEKAGLNTRSIYLIRRPIGIFARHRRMRGMLGHKMNHFACLSHEQYTYTV
jgi:hypothetical protein